MTKECLHRVAGESKGCLHYLSPRHPGTCGFCGLKDEFLCTEALKKLTPHLSYSAVRTLNQCPWKFYLTYMLGYKIKDAAMPEPMKAGTVWDNWLGAGKIVYPDKERYEVSDYLWARLRGLWRAYKQFNLEPKNVVKAQRKIELYFDKHFVVGFADFDFGDGIGEAKLSSRPDFYLNKYFIQGQAGSYLMANPDWEYVTMLVARLPGLKQGKKESIDEFEDRVYLDVCQRPTYYFMNYKPISGSFGKKFYRGEFDFDYITRMYVNSFKMLNFYIREHCWPKNDLSCMVPTTCQFLESRKSGVLSPTLFTKKSKPKRKII